MSIGNFSCVVKPFSDNDWLYAISTVFYALEILGSCILMKDVSYMHKYVAEWGVQNLPRGEICFATWGGKIKFLT